MNRLQRHLPSVRSRSAVVVMALGAMVALTAAPAPATAELGQTGEGIEVPFRAEQVPVETSVVDDERCEEGLTVTVISEGRGTHLGRYTAEQVFCGVIDPETGVRLLLEGESTVTAADGSQLFSEFESTETPTEIPGVFEQDGTVTFVGGTGRFEGASGSAVISGTSPGVTIIVGTLVLAL